MPAESPCLLNALCPLGSPYPLVPLPETAGFPLLAESPLPAPTGSPLPAELSLPAPDVSTLHIGYFLPAPAGTPLPAGSPPSLYLLDSPCLLDLP